MDELTSFWTWNKKLSSSPQFFLFILKSYIQIPSSWNEAWLRICIQLKGLWHCVFQDQSQIFKRKPMYRTVSQNRFNLNTNLCTPPLPLPLRSNNHRRPYPHTGRHVADSTGIRKPAKPRRLRWHSTKVYTPCKRNVELKFYSLSVSLAVWRYHRVYRVPGFLSSRSN